MESLATFAGFILTLFVFSYVLRDTFLYRLAVYIFVGLAAAFTALVTWESLIVPLLDTDGERALLFIGLIFALLLLLKPFPALTPLSNLALAFIIAVGMAVALVGALTGSLLPLTIATARSVQGNWLEGAFIVFGVVTSLLYFQYLGGRRPPQADQMTLTEAPADPRPRLVRWLGGIGQGFIAIALGAFYASAILTSLTIFSERISFLFNFGG